MAYLDSSGLQTFFTKLKTTFAKNIGIATGDSKVTIKLKDGAATPNDLASVDIPAATTAAAGVMSKADKSKLDGIEAGANNYTHPTTAGNKHIPAEGSSGQILGWDSAGTAKWIDAPETGVTKITAGSNVSISPVSGTGEVTVSATDTTYESKTAASGGTAVSLVTTGEKFTWNGKQDALTEAQITACNSGISPAKVEEYDEYRTGKQDTIDSDHKLSYSLISGTPTIPDELADLSQDATHRLVTDTEKYTWNGKQDVITFNTAYNPSSNKAATMTDVLNATAGAVMYQGTLASKNAFEALTNYKKGYYWIVSTAFTTTGGVNLEVGNMVIAHADYSSAFSEANFDFIQGDIEAIPDSVINALS